jgi:hypothetical protein
MSRGAVLNDTVDSFHASSVDLIGSCQKLQDQARELLEPKFEDASTRLNCSVKALTGREFHLEPAQVNILVGVTSFALGAFAAKEKRIVWNHPLQVASSLNNCHKIVDSSAKLEHRLDSMETTYSHGISTVENWRGQKWLHQEGYARVPIHKDGADWWREENLTWVKTSHYLETRNDDGSFFRTYKNGGIQIRFGNGYEVYEGSFPERRKIVLNTGKVDCRAQQLGILSAVGSDLEN